MTVKCKLWNRLASPPFVFLSACYKSTEMSRPFLTNPLLLWIRFEPKPTVVASQWNKASSRPDGKPRWTNLDRSLSLQLPLLGSCLATTGAVNGWCLHVLLQAPAFHNQSPRRIDKTVIWDTRGNCRFYPQLWITLQVETHVYDVYMYMICVKLINRLKQKTNKHTDNSFSLAKRVAFWQQYANCHNSNSQWRHHITS